MARDFESFIVDPSLLDPSIDATNLRTTTPTRQELLSDVPEFSGIKFDPTQKDYVSDLYALYSGQLPSTPAPAVTAPDINIPLPGGGGGGGGGQTTATTTAPITAPATTPTSGGGITPDNTFIGGGATLEDAGGTAPGGLYATDYQGEGVGNLADYPVNTGYGTNPATGQPYQTPRTIADQNAVLGQTFNDQQDPSFWENAKNKFIQTGEDIGGFFANLGDQGIDIGKLAGTTILNLVGKAAFGFPLVGTALSLIGGALPPRDPRQNALDNLYPDRTSAGTISSGLMKGYNPVSGGLFGTEVTYGLQKAYDKRIEDTRNSLQKRYPDLTKEDLDSIQSGNITDAIKAKTISETMSKTYGVPTVSNLVQNLADFQTMKTKEKGRLDIFSGDIDERDQMLEDISLQQKIDKGIQAADDDKGSEMLDTSTKVNPFENIDTGVGEFDIDPITDVTQLGTGTVLGKEGIERFDDAEADMSNTGTAIDAFNQANRQQHFDNTQKLKNAVAEGKISNETYNKLSAFDATKTMSLDPVTGALSSIAYQGVQTLAGDQGVGDFLGDTARNIQGVSGNLTPEEQVQYQEIISGEDIYRDPILGMVEPPAPMTLADDRINRMTDDVDLDLFDITPSSMAPQDIKPLSPPTGTNRPGGDRRDDSPAPSAPKRPTSAPPGEKGGPGYVAPAPTPAPAPKPQPTAGSRGRDTPPPAPSPSPKTSQNVTTSQFQAFRDTGSTPSPSRPSSPAPNYGPPSQSSSSNGNSGGCFLASTLVTMADGSTKAVEQIDLGDNVAKGGKVFAVGKFLINDLYDYKGIKVAGSHMVNEDDNWVRVEDSKHGKSLGDDEHTVYVFGSENRRILINDILFTDYFETTEQKKLIDNEKDFFNNWKQYSKEHNESNVNILNAS